MCKKSWSDWFLSTPAGHYFIKIDEDYLNNTYNFYGLRQKIPHFNAAFELIHGPYIDPEDRTSEWPDDIDNYGICLFGLLHARFLLTEKGQKRMHKKYINGDFPQCPRTLCKGSKCLPYGKSDNIGQSEVLMFCPNCNDVYYMNNDESITMDGAFFGPNWVHPFLERYKELVPDEIPEKYVPRIFGFHVAQV